MNTSAAAASATPFPNASTSKPAGAGRGSRGGRPPAFDPNSYPHRNVVERCLNRLKQRRSVATRYDTTTTSFQATITIAAIPQWP